jgi:hypothetical protein
LQGLLLVLEETAAITQRPQAALVAALLVAEEGAQQWTQVHLRLPA